MRVAILDGVASEVPPRLLELARDQAGVISRRQVIGSGMSSRTLVSKKANGRWPRIYPGVYATFTGPIGRNARLWAVVLYAGAGAQLSHETAAELLRMTDERCSLIHLTIPRERRVRPLRGVVIHRSSHLEQGWRFARSVPPHTLVEETILDLLDAAANFDDAVGWIADAFQRNLTNEASLKRALSARKRIRWRAHIEEAIPLAAGGTHSTLEYRHDRDVQRAHGLPEPVKQAKFRKPDGTNGYRDRCYPQYGGLVIELDGKRFHPAERRSNDQERDNQAAVTGTTLRYGWADVTRKACETARQEAAALRHRGWTGSLKPCSRECRALTG